MNLQLKFAIIAAGKSQRRIAAETNIPENRLSEIVCSWANPREGEIEALSRALSQPAAVLFGNELAKQPAAGPREIAATA